MTLSPNEAPLQRGFLDALGCDLEAEAAVLAPPALPALKTKLLEGVAREARHRIVRSGLAVGLVSLVILWVAPQSMETPARPAVAEAPASARAALPTPATATPRAPTADSVRPAPPSASSSAAHHPHHDLLSVAAQPPEVTSAATTAPPEAPAVPPPPSPGTGDLAEQVEALGVAASALEAGDLGAAQGAYAAYLGRWPTGHFRAEAELGAVHVLAARHDDGALASTAARLAEDPELATHRGELLEMQAEALAHLHRCAEAEAVAAPLGRAAVGRVKRGCSP